jgi:hypothetical protein
MNTLQILRKYKEKNGHGCILPDSMIQKIEQADELRELIDREYDRMKSDLRDEGVDILDSFDFYMDIEIPTPPEDCIPDDILDKLSGHDYYEDCPEYTSWFADDWTPTYLLWWESKFEEETKNKETL